jgi:AcrR family transcriptional regulator
LKTHPHLKFLTKPFGMPLLRAKIDLCQYLPNGSVTYGFEMSRKSDTLLAEPNALSSQTGPGSKARRSRQDSQSEKRAGILRAAQTVFERAGYDGASMNDIAAEAAVSKPTLYVYFDSKEKLFDALIETMCCSVPESVLELDAGDSDIESQLTRCGIELMVRIARPERVDILRVVAGATGKFPEIGQKFFAAGPGRAIEKFRTYLAAVTQRGWLRIADVDLAAFQLLELIQSVHMRRMLFAVAPTPGRADIERTVRGGVRVFIAAYAPRPSGQPAASLRSTG